jgi:hypothetical protein
MFAQQLGREFAEQALGEERGGVALFSGYPPMSKRLYQSLRGTYNRQIKVIFLCSSQFEKLYEDRVTEWRRLVVPAEAIGRPSVAYNDIGRLAKRIETVSRGTILLSLEFQKRLADNLIGKPLTVLRNEIIDRLRQVRENLPATKLTINEIVL